ncbi:MBOAT family O-acyltransferase [Alkalihalophilus marmarensis]|uniref:D-alanyl-lipoteichoic acid acyltransferase DltB, MBOAT superfamily n=1 Tax=Alkalihalophilus marmarensis DSM 21297 TaxID=1188261 RepID=U6SMA7_9BACI|nr:MBOAT family protein [Alkalihalophilus marmarensis]ERN52050.1 hypothetical protein A33I_18325 [Alkalihalophilus marmarensis DSM 21297]
MLFNSYVFIFAFLPITVLIYYLLNYAKQTNTAKLWLVGSSLFFYSWWNIIYLPLILASMIFNYLVGTKLGKMEKSRSSKRLLTFGIIANVALLGYFKYADFFIQNVNLVSGANFSMLNLALPLAISFFTFQQIAYLVDAYRGETKEYNFLNYSLFVSFFPQLIAGPIVHHKEMMPQFEKVSNLLPNGRNISMGLFIFSMGLFKKVVIADTFAIHASRGFNELQVLTFTEGWITSLAYTFQLYFDFSGYTDMAIGAALLLNISLPVNFNSPYKSLNIQDFWRRWHMTLGRFLTHYLYIPLGGNRKGIPRTYVNLFIVFFISGLWHGAGWTFVLWGCLHGAAMMINRFWQQLGLKMHWLLAWFLTFNFVNIAWVFFRAESWQDATKVLAAMFGLNGFELPGIMYRFVSWLEPIGVTFTQETSMEFIYWPLLYIVIGFIIALAFKNTVELLKTFKPTTWTALGIALLFVYALLNMNRISEFLYFNF